MLTPGAGRFRANVTRGGPLAGILRDVVASGTQSVGDADDKHLHGSDLQSSLPAVEVRLQSTQEVLAASLWPPGVHPGGERC